MNKFILPNRTVESFENTATIPYNINLLLNRYLLFSEEAENIKKEVFLYLTRDDRNYKDMIAKYFAKLKKEHERKTKGEKNSFNKILKETNEIFKRITTVRENGDFEKLGKKIGQNIRLIKEQIFSSASDVLRDYHAKIEKLGLSKIIFTTSSRLIVGLGSTSVLETSIKLHHIYGVPYIPSSAIKGVLRVYKMWELSEWNVDLLKALELAISLVYEKCHDPDREFNEKLSKISIKELKREHRVLIDKKDEIIKKQNQFLSILSIFGSQLSKGSLIVFDAFPEKFEGFDIDIMNPHYPDYYQGTEPPADWQNPNPIQFLTIPAGIKFNFYFMNPYEQLETDLKNALSILGIGAKTSLGYGVFNI